MTRNWQLRLRSLATASVVSAALAACASSGVNVRTALAPGAADELSAAHTYRFMTAGAGRGSAVARGFNDRAANDTNRTASGGEVVQPTNPANSPDPIANSQITHRQVRENVAAAMDARGYQRDQGNGDLSIAYYVGVNQRLQVQNYNYGYPFWGWGWRWGPSWGNWPQQQVTTYDQGTLIIDVLDRSGRHLLWRGVGQGQVPSSERDYPDAIRRAVDEVMKKFPGRPATYGRRLRRPFFAANPRVTNPTPPRGARDPGSTRRSGQAS